MFKIGRLMTVAGLALGLSSCTSLHESARLYFVKTNQLKGAEGPVEVKERLAKDAHINEIMHGGVKAGRVLQCTLLRNQLYVAKYNGVSGHDGDLLTEAVMLMEKAYQENDSAFLAACEEVTSSKVGQVFMAVQQEYLYLLP
jgi:hypothetical protein